MKAKGTITSTPNAMGYKFAVALPEATFLVRNEKGNLREDDYGREALVTYDP